MPLLLDTCAAIWFADGAGLKKAATEALDRSVDQEEEIVISPITAWEVGLLTARGRLAWPISPTAWFQRLAAANGIGVCSLTPEILIDSSFLPGNPPADPADRIVIASARAAALTIVTRDRAILAYADAGHVRAIDC